MVVVCASGYFNPLHKGHLEYLEQSKRLGDCLIVIVNNDKQVELKGSKKFMDEKERCKIIESLKCVDYVFLSIDKGKSVNKTLEKIYDVIKIDIFTNGGDVTKCREEKVCKKLGIKCVYGLGEKIQSSSWLLKGEKNGI